MNHRRSPATGYSLVELLVVLALAAILGTLAVASYDRQVRASRRLDARTALVALAAAQERHYLEHGRYADALAATAPAPATPAGPAAGRPDAAPGTAVLLFDDPAIARHYALRIAAADALGYRLEARTVGVQRADTDCARFELEGTGRRNAIDASGADTTRRCWG